MGLGEFYGVLQSPMGLWVGGVLWHPMGFYGALRGSMEFSRALLDWGGSMRLYVAL